MEVEILLVTERYSVHFVRVEARSQSDRTQCLGLTAGEDGRSVRHGQHVDCAPDGADFGGLAAIQADAFVQNKTADGVALHIVVIQFGQGDFLCPFVLVHSFFGEILCDEFVDHFREFLAAFLFAQSHFGYGIDLVVGILADFLAQFLVVGLVAVNAFVSSFGHLGGEGFLRLYLILDGFVGGFEGIDHFGFTDELHLTFHHRNGIGGGAYHQFDVGIGHLFQRGVDHELSVDARYAYFGDGCFERDVRNGDGRRGGQSGQRIGLGMSVVGKQLNDDLRLGVIVRGKHGAQDAVHQTGDEDLFVVGAHFAFHESAGEAAGCGERFFVLDGQGKEIGAFLAFIGCGYGGQHDRAAHSYDSGSGGLFGPYTGLDGDGATVLEGNGLRKRLWNLHGAFLVFVPFPAWKGRQVFCLNYLLLKCFACKGRQKILREDDLSQIKKLAPQACAAKAALRPLGAANFSCPTPSGSGPKIPPRTTVLPCGPAADGPPVRTGFPAGAAHCATSCGAG